MDYGINYSEFSDLINKLEVMGADVNKIAERVLDAGCEPAKRAFARSLPYDTKTRRRTYPHARDTVNISNTKTARKSKNKYRLIEAKTKKIGADGKSVPYLYYLEHTGKPWINKAYRNAQSAASEPMKQALLEEIEKHIK